MSESTITLWISLFTAIAAIVSPIITAIITQWGARRVKTAELAFSAKVDAFLSFLTVASDFAEPLGKPSKEKYQTLQTASAHAFLFASENTQNKIATYGNLLGKNSFAPEDIKALAQAHRAAILAMQSDIKSDQK